jgi:hypothetical protein
VNKENIFEELNKMRNLMVAKAGTVISEQANNINTDIETVKKEMNKGALVNSDEQKVVDVLKKYGKDKATLQNFLNQYKTTTGFALTDQLPKQFDSNTDQGEIRDLNSVLSKIGVTFEVGINNDRTKFVAAFKGLDGAAAQPAAGTRTPEAIKNINTTFCGVKNGIISSGTLSGKKWADYKRAYSVTAAEEAEAQKTCPTVQTGIQSSPSARNNSGQSSVNSRFSKSAESLGIQGGKMDLQTLQSILKTLESGQSTPAVATTATQGTPDLAQLTAALNQLNA